MKIIYYIIFFFWIIKTAANSSADWAIAFLFIICGCPFLLDENSIHPPI